MLRPLIGSKIRLSTKLKLEIVIARFSHLLVQYRLLFSAIPLKKLYPFKILKSFLPLVLDYCKL